MSWKGSEEVCRSAEIVQWGLQRVIGNELPVSAEKKFLFLGSWSLRVAVTCFSWQARAKKLAILYLLV
ncbi:MAG: hypothetical protein GXO34_07885 [Deltaproteobacteria bacterium]|nr:hypothetical protein [Deltaproteobacteria bacterium]